MSRTHWLPTAGLTTLVIVTLLLSGTRTAAQEPGAAVAPVQLSGEGAITEEGIWSHTSVVVDRDGSRTVTGRMISHIDLTSVGLGLVHLAATLDCLRVHGNRAWFSGTTSYSSDHDLVPVGTPVIGFVQDRPGRPDVLHVELEAVRCSDKPALPPSQIEYGDFDVQR